MDLAVPLNIIYVWPTLRLFYILQIHTHTYTHTHTHTDTHTQPSPVCVDKTLQKVYIHSRN